jgi:hypothetical protein
MHKILKRRPQVERQRANRNLAHLSEPTDSARDLTNDAMEWPGKGSCYRHLVKNYRSRFTGIIGKDLNVRIQLNTKFGAVKLPDVIGSRPAIRNAGESSYTRPRIPSSKWEPEVEALPFCSQSIFWYATAVKNSGNSALCVISENNRAANSNAPPSNLASPTCRRILARTGGIVASTRATVTSDPSFMRAP